MDIVEKWPDILQKSCVIPQQDFQSMFGYFSRLCMKVLRKFIKIGD